MYSNRPVPEAISHRGLRTSAPENSIPAFLAALAAGADAIELDVHASLDGVVYVHHDFDFVDASGVKRPIAASDSKEVDKARLDGDIVIPRLDAVLEAVGRKARVYIEIKPAGIENDVTRCLRRHFVGYDNYAVHSFDHRIVKRMLELIPSVQTGILQVGYPVDSCEAMRRAGASDLWQHADFVDERLVADVKSCGGRLIVWTANNDAQWNRLAAIGVDGICTDRIDAYVEWRNAPVA
ncbi:MAG TPA: glycerophosphodiester phosphodiesterase [Gemmatimonadaceae bacterium]|nr:glycerophosphodiester phosphodiesterase [Gemmatimonadaceae bacterium]